MYCRIWPGVFCAFFLISSQLCYGDLITWNFGDDNATFDVGTPNNFSVTDFTIGNTLGTVADPVNSSSASNTYAGATGTGNIGNAFRIGTLNTGVGGSGYFEVILTANSGYTLSLQDFDFGARSTSTGPQTYSLRTSLDSFSSSVFDVAVSNNSTWSFKDNSFSAVNTTSPGGSLTLRLFGFGGSGSPGSNTINGRLDDITLSVIATQVTAVPEPSSFLLGSMAACSMLVVRRRRK